MPYFDPADKTQSTTAQYQGNLISGLDALVEDHLEGECLNRNCDHPFCPQHSDVNLWAESEDTKCLKH